MGVQKQRRPELAFTHLLLGGGCNRENAPQAQTKQKLVPFSKHNLRHCVEATRWKLIRCASPSPIIAQLNLSPLGGLDYVGVHSVRLSVGCKFRTTLPWGSCSAKSSSLWVFVFFSLLLDKHFAYTQWALGTFAQPSVWGTNVSNGFFAVVVLLPIWLSLLVTCQPLFGRHRNALNEN